MFIITTSGRPIQRMRTLCNDLQRTIPNAIRINRGKLNIAGIFEKALEMGSDRVIIVERWKGGPGNIKLYMLPFGPEQFATIYLASVKTQDEIGKRVKVRGGLSVTIDTDTSSSTKHLANFLSNFLHTPLLEEAPKDTGFKASVHLSNFYGKVKISFTMPPTINEIGPTLIVSRVINNLGNHF